MQMKQCPNGHFYDQSRTSQCPYCSSESANINVAKPLFSQQEPVNVGATVPLKQEPMNHTMSVNLSPGDENERTQVLIKKEIGIDPVVGWLICIEGKEKGRDYRIHSDNNFIGRAEKMDVCIRGDDTISRENHAVISYDSRSKQYYFSPGDGRSIVRVNDNAVFCTIKISAYDKIELGSTKLIFLPLCGEAFNWLD